MLDRLEKKRAASKAWRAANPELALARQRAYRARNAERLAVVRRLSYPKYRDKILKRQHEKRQSHGPADRRREADYWREAKYGLSPDAYDAMVIEAAGFCPLCDQQDHGTRGTGLVVDHHHARSEVRGLICSTCNTALGYIERHGLDASWYYRAAAYLK